MKLTDLPRLHSRLLGPVWFDLDPVVRQVLGTDQVIRATLEIHHGRGLAARIVQSALRLPVSPDGPTTTLRITLDADAERWTRTFGRRSLVTTQRALSDGCLGERIGPLELRFRLDVTDGALSYVQLGAVLILGRWSIRLPRLIAPRVKVRMGRRHGEHRARVNVAISAPVIGFLMSYEGFLEVEPAT